MLSASTLVSSQCPELLPLCRTLNPLDTPTRRPPGPGSPATLLSMDLTAAGTQVSRGLQHLSLCDWPLTPSAVSSRFPHIVPLPECPSFLSGHCFTEPTDPAFYSFTH